MKSFITSGPGCRITMRAWFVMVVDFIFDTSITVGKIFSLQNSALSLS